MKRISSAVIGLLALALGTNALAAAFTAGNVVIYRVGDGSVALSSTSTVVFLDEYQTNGTSVQSIQMPTGTNVSGTVTNYPLTCGGNATTEGLMTLSTNGLYLLVPGYATTPGFAIPSAATGTTLRRAIGIVANNGSTNTAVQTALTDLASTGNVRGAASGDGINIWAAGGVSGVRYFTNGQTTASTQLNTQTPLNNRGLSIYGDRLFGAAQSGVFRLWAFNGANLPTTTGQTASNLTGYTATAGNARQFFMTKLNGDPANTNIVDTVYVADNGGAGGIIKWSLVSNSWTSNGLYQVGGGFSGLTGVRQISGSTTNVALFAASTNEFFAVVDTSGYNAAPTGTGTTNASASALTAFCGIAFVPVAPGCPNPSCSVSGPTTVCQGVTNSYSVSGSGGTAPYTFSWSISSDDSSLFQGGGSTASGSPVNIVAGTGGGSYTLTVTPVDANSCTGSPACTYGPVTVTTSVTPSVTISASPSNAVCAGTSVTFTATPTAGGTLPSYNFRVNTSSVQSGSSATYTTSGLSDGDLVDVILTSNDPCRSQNAVASTTITMSVEDPPVGGTATNITGTVCAGQNVVITLSGYSGNIQWQKRTTGSFADLASQTNSVLTNAAFSATNNFRALVSGTLCPVDSSSTATVYAVARPTNTVTGASSVCVGTTNNYSVATDASSPTYSWTITSTGGSAAFVGGTTADTVTVNSDSATSYSLVVTTTDGTTGCSRSTTNSTTVNTVVTSVSGLYENFDNNVGPYPYNGWTATTGDGSVFWSNATSAASSGYTGASGGANVTITQNAATNAFLISPVIDFTSLTSGSLSMGVRKSATFTNDMAVEFSTNNGASFDAYSTAITIANATNDASYHLVTLSVGSAIDNQSQVQIRWHAAGNVGHETGTYRMDDIKLSGTAPAAAISPSGPITNSSAVTLTATRGSSYLWSPNGETTQSISATNTGSYSVQITYDNGCPALSAPVSVTISGSASSFQIISVVPSGISVLVTWITGIGRTNALQATAGDASGGYSTNNFNDIFTVTNTVGTTTNYLDIGGATNNSRYYRVRLVP